MLRIRSLEKGDQEGLSSFITDIYREYPSAMWFETEPTQETLSELFQNKLNGMREKRVVDMIAVQPGEREQIVGEVEVVHLTGPVGSVGIIIRKEHRNKGLGSELLEHALENAVSLGITELHAEVAEKNAGAQEFFKNRGFILENHGNGKQNSGILLFRKALK